MSIYFTKQSTVCRSVALVVYTCGYFHSALKDLTPLVGPSVTEFPLWLQLLKKVRKKKRGHFKVCLSTTISDIQSHLKNYLSFVKY